MILWFSDLTNTRPWGIWVGISRIRPERRGIPGHALHEKGLQRQKNAGPLASSQERRAAVVPRINRLSTACQPVFNRTVCSPIGLHCISFVRASGETFTTVVFDALEALEGKMNGCIMGTPSCRRPVLNRPAPPPRRAPPSPDPPVVCPGFWLDRLLRHKGFGQLLGS